MTDDQAKATGRYMTAYLKKLAQETGRNQLYERLGWHEDHRSFVLGQQVMHRDGRITLHKPSPIVRTLTSDGLKAAGTLEGWKRAMGFYARPGYEAQRFFIYCALGAPLLHLAGSNIKGALVLATGSSGRGKTMTLKACSSIWGHPDALVINGNKAGSTINALYTALGLVHSLPFLWDEITQRESDELRDFLLNVSQGKGKLRLGSNSQLVDQYATWETISLATANSDVAHLISSGGRDADAHQRRLFSVEFALADTSAKAKTVADQFGMDITEHYGHVGPQLMAAIMKNYDTVAAEMRKNLAMIDGKLAARDASAARFWTAIVAAAYTGAKIAAALGLIPYKVKDDLPWMVQMIKTQCETAQDLHKSPVEMLTSFLNDNLRQTLTISAKAASNLDNVDREPSDRLVIRNEQDAGLIYAEVCAVKDYFMSAGRSYISDKNALVGLGIVVDDKARKNIGAGTRWGGNGTARCWKIDAVKLASHGETPDPSSAPAAAMTPTSNVTPIRKAS